MPNANRHWVGGLCSPRSQREIDIDVQDNFLPNSAWLNFSRVRRALICFAHKGVLELSWTINGEMEEAFPVARETL